MTGPGPPGRGRAAVAGAGLAVLLAGAAWILLAGFPEVLASGNPIPIDGDSHYHLRRIDGALGGALVRFDPLVNWTAGAAIHWADGFDLLGAWFARVVAAGRSPDARRLAVFLWTVVLGLLAIWATVDLARRLAPPGDRATPLASGLLLAAAPAFVEVARFGVVDHHVAECLAMVLLAGWAMRRFPGGDEPPPGLAWEAWGAAAVALATWLFSGGELYVALAATPLGLAAALGRDARRVVGTGGPALLGGAAVAALLAIPALRVHGHRFSFVFPSLLQPALTAAAGLAVLVAARVRRSRRGEGRGGALLSLASGLGVGIAFLAAFPAAGREVASAVEGWLLRRDPWIGTIAEFQPLLQASSPGSWPGALAAAFGIGPLVGIAGLPLAVAEAARSSRARAWTFALVATVLLGLTLLQARFGRIAAPFVAIAGALVVRRLASSLAGPGWTGALASAAPLLGAVAFVASGQVARDALRPAPAPPLFSVYEASLRLELGRTPVAGSRDGVLAPWDYGHAVLGLSGRPVVVNGFGSYLDPVSFREVERAFRGSEDELVATMDRHDLGFLLAGGLVLRGHLAVPGGVPPTVGDPGVLNPAFMKATPLSPLVVAGSGMPASGVPHLTRLMPIHASRAVAGGLAFPLPIVWVYERVAGAVLTGRAPPGERVEGEIALVEWGRPHRYRAWTVAGPDGSWRMRVAVPGGLDLGTLRTAPAWTVAVPGSPPVEVRVPEAAVRAGTSIAVP